MDFLKLKFTNYGICYYANGKERKASDCIIKISCYVGDDKKVKQELGGTALTMKFFKDDSEIHPNIYKEYMNTGDIVKYGLVTKVSLSYPISQFNDIISILRHESHEKRPLYLFIEGKEKDSPKGGLLTEGQVKDKEYKDVPVKCYRIE